VWEDAAFFLVGVREDTLAGVERERDVAAVVDFFAAFFWGESDLAVDLGVDREVFEDLDDLDDYVKENEDGDVDEDSEDDEETDDDEEEDDDSGDDDSEEEESVVSGSDDDEEEANAVDSDEE